MSQPTEALVAELGTANILRARMRESLEELTEAIEAVLKARPVANKSAVDLLLDALAILLVDDSTDMNAEQQQAFAREAIKKVKDMKL